MDIWDTLILRDRPADAAKTATGRRISLISRGLPGGVGLDPFQIAQLRVEVEAEMAADSPSEEYELADVIGMVLERLGHPPEAARSELAELLAAEEARDEVRWSSPNDELVGLIRESAQPTALLSDFYMSSDLLEPIVSEVTGLRREALRFDRHGRVEAPGRRHVRRGPSRIPDRRGSPSSHR